ncbi:unnamed protein product [Brassica rapa]|uniref:Secreted protein n=1 Tax=Brassica campestris TaxID=3711 RepID=A0A8D9CWB2_BRACM|nr:unnamed protein product [Brassica rapa]
MKKSSEVLSCPLCFQLCLARISGSVVACLTQSFVFLHSANSLDRLCLRFCIADHNEKATYFKSCTK